MIYKFYKILMIITVSIFYNSCLVKQNCCYRKILEGLFNKIDKQKPVLLLEPIKTEGKFNKDNRGKPYVFVTNIKNGTNHEVSIKAGFNFKKNKDVFLMLMEIKQNCFQSMIEHGLKVLKLIDIWYNL